MKQALEATKFEITKPKVLLVEGKDEEVFLGVMLKDLGISDVQIQSLGGKDHFPKKILGLKTTTGFGGVRFLGILRDAEENPAQSAFDSVCSDLKRAGLVAPKTLFFLSDELLRIGVFIAPDNKSKGMLEDLCLNSLEETNEIRHTDAFFHNAEIEKEAKDFSKRRLQAWLSIARKDRPLQRELGRAAEAGFLNFSHPCFERLKLFLEQFR